MFYAAKRREQIEEENRQKASSYLSKQDLYRETKLRMIHTYLKMLKE